MILLSGDHCITVYVKVAAREGTRENGSNRPVPGPTEAIFGTLRPDRFRLLTFFTFPCHQHKIRHPSRVSSLYSSCAVDPSSEQNRWRTVVKFIPRGLDDPTLYDESMRGRSTRESTGGYLPQVFNPFLKI